MATTRSVRRELGRADYARRGVAVLAVVLVLLGLTYVRASGRIGGDPELSAQLVNAGGSLRPGSDVKVRGVIIGKVTSISRGDRDGVRVGLRVQPEHLETVPDNVVARILPATVFGTSFVDLVTHGEASSTPLREGAEIAADDTQGTLELQQALDDIDRLVTALGPAELASAIGSAATALDGQGAQLGGTIDRLDAYLGRINPRMPLLRSDVRKLAENLELVDRVAPDLLQATDDSLVTLNTIATQEAAIAEVIAAGTSLVNTADAVLDDNRHDLVRYLNNAAALLDAVHDNRRAGISGAIEVNTRLGKQAKSINHRGFARTDAIFQTRIPDYYTVDQRPSYGAGGAAGRATFPSMVEGDR